MKSLKSLAILFVSLAFSSLVICISEKNSVNKVGFSTENNNEISGTIASTYSLAKLKVDPYYLNNQQDFTGVAYVQKLPERKQLRGEVTTVDEVASETDYYDGSLHFKTTISSCPQWTTQKEVCMKQKACGWCASSNNCISGNTLGPLAPCLRGRFMFSSPQNNWNPLETDQVNVKTQIIGGAQLTTMTPK